VLVQSKSESLLHQKLASFCMSDGENVQVYINEVKSLDDKFRLLDTV